MSNDSSAFDTGPGRADSTAGVTGGNWRIGMHPSGANACGIYSDIQDVEYGGRCVAHVYGLPSHTSLPDMGRWENTEAMANACLIAAAPRIRDALDNLIIAMGMGWDLDGFVHEAIEALKCARSPAAISQDDKAPERR